MPVEDDQLLAKEDVFEDEFRLAAGQVEGCADQQLIVVGSGDRFEPRFQAFRDRLNET